MTTDNTALMTNQVEQIYVTQGRTPSKDGGGTGKNLGFLINKKIYWQFSLFDEIIEMNNEAAYLNIRFDKDGCWGYVDEANDAVLDKQVIQIEESNELLFSASSQYAKQIARKGDQQDSFREDYLWGIGQIQDDYIGIKHYSGQELADILKVCLAKADINDMHFFVTRCDEKDHVEVSFVMPVDDSVHLNFVLDAKQQHLGNETNEYGGVTKTYKLTGFDVSYFYYSNPSMGIKLLQRHKYMADPYPLYAILNNNLSNAMRYEDYDDKGKIAAVRYSSDHIGNVIVS